MPSYARLPLVQELQVEDLFGRYSYDIKLQDSPQGSHSRVMLLHGDNGSGKTTILRMLWNLLSPADDKGHRSYLAATPFRRFTVKLSNGVSIDIVRDGGHLVGSYDLTLHQSGQEDLLVRLVADDDLTIRSSSRANLELALRLEAQGIGGADDSLLNSASRKRLVDYGLEDEGLEQFHQFIAAQQINPLFLADDRSLYSDDEEIGRARDALQRRTKEREGDRDRLAILVARELQLTMRRVNDWIRELTLGGQSSGSANANQIYTNVLRQLGRDEAGESDGTPSADLDAEVLNLLETIEATAPRYEEFDLVPAFDAPAFTKLFKDIGPTTNRRLAAEIVSPYLSTVAGRYDALAAAEQTLRVLIPTINDFFRDKEMTFSPKDGLQIVTPSGEPLAVESLSSGERQLTMLLCTTLLAQNDSKVFIIDEPELSLGVEWQRKILTALLDLTERSNLQFLVATHSIEVISRHADSLVQLIDKNHPN